MDTADEKTKDMEDTDRNYKEEMKNTWGDKYSSKNNR